MDKLKQEIIEAGRKSGLPQEQLGQYCHGAKDGDCWWKYCPQNNPETCRGHCPLDIHEEERGYQ